MGVHLRKVELAFELAHGLIAEDVFDLFRVLVHVVGGVVGFVREVEFPEPVIPHDLPGALQARGRQKDARFRGGGLAGPHQ